MRIAVMALAIPAAGCAPDPAGRWAALAPLERSHARLRIAQAQPFPQTRAERTAHARDLAIPLIAKVGPDRVGAQGDHALTILDMQRAQPSGPGPRAARTIDTGSADAGRWEPLSFGPWQERCRQLGLRMDEMARRCPYLVQPPS